MSNTSLRAVMVIIPTILLRYCLRIWGYCTLHSALGFYCKMISWDVYHCYFYDSFDKNSDLEKELVLPTCGPLGKEGTHLQWAMRDEPVTEGQKTNRSLLDFKNHLVVLCFMCHMGENLPWWLGGERCHTGSCNSLWSHSCPLHGVKPWFWWGLCAGSQNPIKRNRKKKEEEKRRKIIKLLSSLK